MEQLVLYISLFSIIIAVGIVFNKAPVPTSLLLVVTGMVLGEIPNFPRVDLDSELVLNLFLPILIYQISVVSSWRDLKKSLRPITLLSFGHVIFITILVAVAAHYIIPGISWPLAFVLGAVVSPPDDVAIIAIAEKVQMPKRILTVLKGEAMFNDATALVIFRFALASVITHQFYVEKIFATFLVVLVGETLYGLLVGFVLGTLRTRVKDPVLQMMFSFITPFVAYLPAEYAGGSGVLATAVTGLVIESIFIEKFSPEVRLLARSVWQTLAFAIEKILFLLLGLEIRYIHQSISAIPVSTLLLYSTTIIAVIIIGRFIWVFPSAYLPRFLFPSIRKRDPYPPWQYVFVVSWAGMRGGISLAAALAVPILPMASFSEDPRDLIIFLVFCSIVATLVLQGFALPWVLKILKIPCYGQAEEYQEHINELKARHSIAISVLKWLKEYEQTISDNPEQLSEVKFRVQEYQNIKKQLKESIKSHDGQNFHSEEASELKQMVYLSNQITEVERRTLLQLWHQDKISHALKNKLMTQLDHKAM